MWAFLLCLLASPEPVAPVTIAEVARCREITFADQQGRPVFACYFDPATGRCGWGAEGHSYQGLWLLEPDGTLGLRFWFVTSASDPDFGAPGLGDYRMALVRQGARLVGELPGTGRVELR